MDGFDIGAHVDGSQSSESLSTDSYLSAGKPGLALAAAAVPSAAARRNRYNMSLAPAPKASKGDPAIARDAIDKHISGAYEKLKGLDLPERRPES